MKLLKKKSSDTTLLQGDCFEVMKGLPDKSVDLVLTDPPYYFRSHQNRSVGADGKSAYANSDLYKEGNKLSTMGSFTKEDVYNLLNECERVLKKFRGYFFCNEYLVPFYTNWALEHKYWFCIITLEKPLKVVNRNRYSTNAEYLIRIYKPGAGIKVLDYSDENNDVNWLSSVQAFDRIPKKLHPAEKPLNILNGVIQLNTDPNDVVLDPFMGSGSTGVVCINSHRKFIGIELDEKYYNIAVDRCEKSHR